MTDTINALVESMAKAIGRAQGVSDKTMNVEYICEVLPSGLLVRRSIIEDAIDDAIPEGYVRIPRWKFVGLDRDAKAAIVAVKTYLDNNNIAQAMAESDAKFDGRDWQGMGRMDRERYIERSRKSLATVLSSLDT